MPVGFAGSSSPHGEANDLTRRGPALCLERRDEERVNIDARIDCPVGRGQRFQPCHGHAAFVRPPPLRLNELLGNEPCRFHLTVLVQ